MVSFPYSIHFSSLVKCPYPSCTEVIELWNILSIHFYILERTFFSFFFNDIRVWGLLFENTSVSIDSFIYCSLKQQLTILIFIMQ